ncbi:glycosyltransferase involved in cell wall biosynthesis [Rhizobium skierniewicense]|uniref:Glycosyltransferase involved in cell wall biosynthesis n=1 Tax=Rhizobium skierniewicense TaxID=984260 RepID=A0A7W6G412_9HYPH|nr:glycosyltransferase [Rhizobium skierniewicense]MBB3948154.1 glycosyltransferase involved in cell wall biosynthesis [Rhizobium skierniewicense]
MKICIVSQTFAPQEEGGAEISARLGAMELGKRHDVTVLALGREGDAIAPPGETRLPGDIRVIRLPWMNSYLPLPRKSTAGFLQRARWHLRTAMGAICPRGLTDFFTRERFDLIYAQNSAFMQPALLLAARDASIPVCLHLRDYGLLCPRTSMFRGGDNCERRCLDCSVLNRRMRKLAGGDMSIIAVSDALRKRFISNGVFEDAQWHVMHNTNATENSFDRSLIGRHEAAAPVFTFGYLGAITKEKGVEDLLQAFLSLPNRDNAKLIIAGRGREEFLAKLKTMSKDAPVEFKGFIRPEDIYRVADAIIVPSRWHEPQSRILVEAPIYGVPVIATARGGTPEIVDKQQTGWSYDPAKPDALFKLLNMALSTGQKRWWEKRDEIFPGFLNFKGTAEDTGYYERLEQILVSAAQR